ncbi:MAG: hypothetical protein RMA76_44505 [Deltaproteobacteria bacterium]|jgi:hypothetical protein
MRGVIVAGVTLLASTASAAPPPVPWEVTGTSSTAAVSVEPDTAHRVERRFFEKQDHFLVKTGFSYLSRGDFYSNPGVSIDLSWYPLEFFAIDFVSSTIFFSQLNNTATELRETFGLLPDSQKPYARVTAGGRFAFAYGKVLIEELGEVVHLDASVGLHLGVLATDRAVNLGGDTGLTFQAAVFERFVVWFDFSWFLSFEERSDEGTVASGPMGTVGLGLKL